MEFNFGDFVWWKGEGWQYIGMDEDATVHLCRPVRDHAFSCIEFEQVYLSDDDDCDLFYRENGETISMKHRRKGTLPESKGE